MKRNEFILFFGFLLVIAGTPLHAQTTNEGELVVLPGTVFSTLARFDNTATGAFYNDGRAYFYGHYNNDGTADYLGDTGFNLFVGSQVQNLSGSRPAYLYDVLFENHSTSAPFRLSGFLDIGGEVNFSEGIVNNKDHGGRIRFEEAAYAINTRDASHVNGPVERSGEPDFTFPIGKSGYYRPAEVRSLTDPATVFEGEFHFANSDTAETPHRLTPDDIERIDDEQYWTIGNTSDTQEEEMMVGLSYRDVTTPGFIMEAAEGSYVTIVRWDPLQNLWVDEGGTVDPEREMVTARATGYGRFTFARLKEKTEECHVAIYNAVTPNGDGFNDHFRVEDQGDCVHRFKVKVFNRWGVKVFESDDYGRGGEVFDGYSNGRMTVREGKDQLPSGTYYYTLDYDYDTPEGTKRSRKAGYLYLSTDKGN